LAILYISLVNIILNRAAVPELIQAEFSVSHLKNGLREILHADSPAREKQKLDYSELRDSIGKEGASQRTAAYIVKSAKNFKLNNA
jgi:lipid-A-disaccharide synthase